MNEKKYFIAITSDRETNYYNLYFVNASEVKVKKIEMSSGGFVTYDDEPVTLSSFSKSFGEVEPQGYVHIDSLSEFDLEFVNVFDLMVTTETEQEKYSFYIGKTIGFLGNKLPIINKMGRRIFLKKY